jgi:DMSO/TMAO reductase YedYZ molybdopterin-dependent catalytic subunit
VIHGTVTAVWSTGSRRSFLANVCRLGAAALLGTVGAARGTFGAQFSKDQLIIRSPRPEDLETPPHLLTSWITPTELFYVRSHFYTPVVRETEWKLVIDGDVDRPFEMTLGELRRLASTRQVVTLECAGNGRAFFEPRVAGVQWEKGAVGTAEWQGVRLGDILARAGVRRTARYLWLDGADRGIDRAPDFIRSLPLEKALDSATVLAYEMNGEPLPVTHGFPLRAVVPGWEGAYSVKWLTHIRVSERDHDGPFTQTGYRRPRRPVKPGTVVDPADTVPVRELPVKSLITSVAHDAVVSRGAVRIAGFAWVGDAEIRRVDVSTDNGRTWEETRLGRDRAPYAWRQFEYVWRPRETGSYAVLSRATDTRGRVQPIVAEWNPAGYLWNAVDQVRLNVRLE